MNGQAKNKISVTIIIIFGISAVVGVVVGLVVGVMVSSRVVGALSQSSSSSSASISQVLTETASEFNRNLPMMIDRITRLDVTIAQPGNKFMYKYTILEQQEPMDKAQFIATMRPTLVNNYKTSSDMIFFRDMKVVLVYSYHDEEGSELVRIEISPDEF